VLVFAAMPAASCPDMRTAPPLPLRAVANIKWFDVGQEAVGVVAIGQVATGVIAIGQGATGFIAIGQLARGVFVVGQLGYGVVVIGQLAVGLALAGGMVGMGARKWFGWMLALLPPRSRPWPEPQARLSWWRVLLLLAASVGFFFIVARPLWDGWFSTGGVFNQPLR
jgi:hypothetical protein